MSSTSQLPPPQSPVRLTPRGRRTISLAVLGLAALLVLMVLSAMIRSCTARPGEDRALPAAPSSQETVHPSPSQETVHPSPSRVNAPSSRPTATATPVAEDAPADADGLKRSGLLGKGTWKTAQLTVAPAKKTPVVHRYVVQAEDGTGIDPTSAARQISGILNDPRGWTGHQGHSFQLVKDPKQAEFSILLASPGRVQKLCPLDVRMTWSCRAGSKVMLNTDRWLYMTPTYTDLTAYRGYMVNHEVGHFIGKGHVGCPGKGLNAPVMMQQSKRIDGCRPNAWPTLDGK